MNIKAETANFSPRDLDEIRSNVRAVIENERMTQADAARESGVAYSTFSAFLNGTYTGNNDKPAGDIQIWLSSRQEKKRTARSMPKAPDFQVTPSAENFINAMRFAQAMPDIAVIAGGAGIGKTSCAEYYAATNSNVWLVTMEPNTSTVNTMLAEICETMGVIEKSPTKLSGAIRRKVQGTSGLIIIDEAQHLSPQALDQLRSIYDRAGIGIALLGNETVYSRLEGEGRRSTFAQLFSRIGMRVTQPRARAADVCALLKAWGITEREDLKYLKAIAQKPGALRVLTKVLQLSSMLAAGANEDRTIKHYRAAWERLSTSPQIDAA